MLLAAILYADGVPLGENVISRVDHRSRAFEEGRRRGHRVPTRIRHRAPGGDGAIGVLLVGANPSMAVLEIR